MKKILILLLCYGFVQGQLAYSAEDECVELAGVEGDDLVALLLGGSEGALLQVDFDEELACTIQDDVPGIADSTAISYHLSAELDEVVLQATVEGYETWLRIDTDYSGELLLDRKTSEGLGLTDAEFLGDNSQLEASDFFVEFVGRLEIGDMSLRNVETNIPLFEMPYDHYEGRGIATDLSNSEFISTGSIGEELLEDWIMVFDSANQQVYLSKAN